ncbi:MAG TPA: alkaline phytoceramidase [Usitatibacter sp.]|jgi:hypothetical protein|nr:alkaline phytoceramidase [Usitatibacter sp.]
MRLLPAAVLAVAVIALAWHGPIAQPPHYHDFADARPWLGIPHAADVLSNAAFALVAAWGAWRLRRRGVRERLGAALPGYVLFVGALALTALGSAYYHWAPTNARLVWDRLPIALACAALLEATWVQAYRPRGTTGLLPALCLVAVGSVAWWSWTQARGVGDLRPYLLLQGAPLVLIPLWQWQSGAPRRERVGFAVAIALYVLAKVLELDDRAIYAATGLASGHTLKHLAAAAAAAVIVASVTQISTREPSSTTRLVGIAK